MDISFATDARASIHCRPGTANCRERCRWLLEPVKRHQASCCGMDNCMDRVGASIESNASRLNQTERQSARNVRSSFRGATSFDRSTLGRCFPRRFRAIEKPFQRAFRGGGQRRICRIGQIPGVCRVSIRGIGYGKLNRKKSSDCDRQQHQQCNAHADPGKILAYENFFKHIKRIPRTTRSDLVAASTV